MCGLLDLYELRAPGFVARGQAGCWDFRPDYLRGLGMPGEGELGEGRDELSRRGPALTGWPLGLSGTPQFTQAQVEQVYFATSQGW